MIDFRYHVVSLVAVFLALAVGLVLGTTTLNGPLLHDLKGRSSDLAASNATLEQRNDALNTQLQSRDAFATAITPFAAAGRLTHQTIALVSAPNVDGGVRNAVAGALAAAGAQVVSDVRLKPAYLDPRQDSVLGSLAAQLAEPGVSLPRGASGADRAAVQLASVLVDKSGPQHAGALALQTSLSAYSTAQLLSVSGQLPRPATMAVLLVPAPPTDTPATQVSATGRGLGALAVALDAACEGVVVAAAGDPGTDPVLPALAKVDGFTAGVSAVPDVETAPGQLAVVFGLMGQLLGKAGSYPSPTAVVGVVPTPSPAPTS